MSASHTHTGAELHTLHAQNQMRIEEAGGTQTPLGRDMLLATFIQEWMFAEVILGTDPIDLVNRMLFSITNCMVEAAVNIANYTGENREDVFEQFEDCIHHNSRPILENHEFCNSCQNLKPQ